MLIVQKFGGSSLADLNKMRRAAAQVENARRQGHDVVAVVSAMGDTTDRLLKRAAAFSPEPPERELAALLSTGEQQSAALLAMLLCHSGIPARSLTGWQAGIMTMGGHGDGKIGIVAPSRVKAALRSGKVAVVGGFQGINCAGDITTLGRGGSDTTAVALAEALRAERCDIFTDVPGIYTADPRLVKSAIMLEAIDYGDMLRLALAGSQVLHSRSVAMAMETGVKINLRSTFSDSAGSVVCALPEERRPQIAGVTRCAATGELCAVGKGAGEKLERDICFALDESCIPVLSRHREPGCIFVKVPDELLLSALDIAHAVVLH